MKIYTVTMSDGSEFDVTGTNNAKARSKACDYLRFTCGYMSQDEMPKFSVREKKEYVDNSLSSAQARYRRADYARKH